MRSDALRQESRQLGRLVAALARRGARLTRAGDETDRVEIHLPGCRGPVFAGPEDLVSEAARRGLVVKDETGWRVSEAGLAFLRRTAAPADAYRRQHLVVARKPSAESATGSIEIVENESPLAWLRRRRGADGRPLISDVQYLAGERLRLDHTRAGLMPRLGVDLSQPPSPRRQAGVTNRVAEAMDSTLAARERVKGAMRFVGPKLGSLLVDVCCDLVGLEEAEKRRNWPRRSGKVVLAIALDRLADHYGLSDAASGPDEGGRIRRWGTDGYRPSAGE